MRFASLYKYLYKHTENKSQLTRWQKSQT